MCLSRNVMVLVAAIVALLSSSPVLAEEEAGIADNSFLIEEAYNQPPGVVQHIQTFQFARDREKEAVTRSFDYTFTQEWPVFSQKHQLSYTIPYSDVRAPGSPSVDGIGDVALNYRYQLWDESQERPAVSPRLSILLSTGDEKKGTGTGTTGYQFNLPVSKGLGQFHYNFNLGATWLPDDDAALTAGGRSRKHDLMSYFGGASIIYTKSPVFQPLLEMLVTNDESIDPADGARVEATSLVVNPGFRYAINFPSGSQLVWGAAAPIALTREGNDYGAFGYLSWEHAFSDAGRK